MRNPRVILPIITCSAALSCMSQRQVELAKMRLELPDIGIGVDSVFCAFDPTASIGNAENKNSNCTEPIHLDAPVDLALYGLLARSLPTASARIRVIVKVNVLRLNERATSWGQTAICAVHLEFFTRQGDRYRRIYEHGASRSGSGGNMTAVELDLIGAVTTECLNGLWTAFSNRSLRDQQVVLFPMRTPIEQLELPILNVSHPARGVYWTFQDLRNNAPDTTLPITWKELKRAPGGYRQVRPLAAWQEKLRPAWGLSDGSALFMNMGREFSELQLEKGYYRTALVHTESISDAELSGMIVGGVITGLLTGWYTIPIGGTTTSLITLYLDMYSGDLLPRPFTDLVEGPLRSSHAFIFSPESAIDTMLCLFIYGGQEACMSRAQHYTLRPVRRPEPMPVELRIGGGTKVDLLLDTNDPKEQVFMITMDPAGVLTVEKAEGQQALDLFQRLDPAKAVNGVRN